MMVTFISQCEKKALSRTRRVLDAFANRIGDNTWQTVITQEGLIAVKNNLKQTATKNTAVSCHWMRSRSRSDLVWIVGNRRKFNSEGVVPVNRTQKNHQHIEWENNWQYLPIIKALAAIAALLHDWGKATLLFQNKLDPKQNTNQKLGDPLRHEWISCLLLHALIHQSGCFESDDQWLSLLSEGGFDESKLIEQVKTNVSKPLDGLPPLAKMVAWLIVTHHRLPAVSDTVDRKSYGEEPRDQIDDVLKSITAAQWGYQNKFDDGHFEKRLPDCFKFPNGLLSHSKAWLDAVKKWSARLLTEQENALTVINNGAWRLVLHHARLSLMLGDHYYSSLAADKKWMSDLNLYANTSRQDDQVVLKQKLDEHLVRVSENALRISQSLSRFSIEMEVARDIQSLKKKSPKAYDWQDKAVDQIIAFKRANEAISPSNYGCFVVNMASTGCGKTIANAKIMRALSEDGESLRFILALGLRTLTLQTGDEYRNRIGLNPDELAVLIGSAAVKALHEQAQISKNDEDATTEELGSESMDRLLFEDLDYADSPTADFLDAIIPKDNHSQANKNKAFLYKPVLACTIDHIIAATETTRGGKYILPCLRLLSSDLVIDEVDDFDGKDLIAIGRLIHLAGMLGRKVMISSATIPPALAEGFFNAYHQGWQINAVFKNDSPKIACVWVDEFASRVHFVDEIAQVATNDTPVHSLQYRALHQSFTTKRVAALEKQPIKRKAIIVNCEDIYSAKSDKESKQQQYFAQIQEQILKLHEQHHTVDRITGKKASFGVVRVANIPPCVALTQYLIQADWDNDVAPKVMAYHSRQIMLLRHVQEKHMDAVLKRKENEGEMPSAFNDPIIREHLSSSSANNVLFIVVATPVEEVGRDHDFDWAVVEPSSYRSIIQLAGRVRRHRNTAVTQANIAIMQYNLKALNEKTGPVFYRPGYENSKSLKLDTHDLCQLLDEKSLNQSVNAIPRIAQSDVLQAKTKLADLEHLAIGNSLANYQKSGANYLQAWLNGCWWMTALPQQLNRFRDSSPDVILYMVWMDEQAQVCEKNQQGRMVKMGNVYGIKPANDLNDQAQTRLWLNRNYEQALQDKCLADDASLQGEPLQQAMAYQSKRFGELTMPEQTESDMKHYWYSDQFGLWLKN